MIKNFNWGHGIALFYVFFVGIVIVALIASFGVDHSLVIDDYYAEDLKYQETYTKKANSLKSDNILISYSKNSQSIKIRFKDSDQVNGKVVFYKPSDKSQDFSLSFDQQETIISTKDLSKGHWKLKVDWSDNLQSYYSEESIYL